MHVCRLWDFLGHFGTSGFFACGGSGSIFSQGAMLHLDFNRCARTLHHGCYQSDWMLGQCAHDGNVKPVYNLSCGLCRNFCGRQMKQHLERVSFKQIEQRARRVDARGRICLNLAPSQSPLSLLLTLTPFYDHASTSPHTHDVLAQVASQVHSGCAFAQLERPVLDQCAMRDLASIPIANVCKSAPKKTAITHGFRGLHCQSAEDAKVSVQTLMAHSLCPTHKVE